MVEFPQKAADAVARSKAKADALIHSDDARKRCQGTLYNAVVEQLRVAETSLLLEGNDPEDVHEALIFVLAGQVAIGCTMLVNSIKDSAPIVCHTAKRVHDLAHWMIDNPLQVVTVDVDTAVGKITDTE